MKTEAELFEMRDAAEKAYKQRRGRSDLWAKMRLLNEILEEDYPHETRRMAKVKREARESFENTELAKTSPKYIPVPEGELAKRYTERKEAQE